MKGVSYAFCTYNMIKQNNEKWIRKSFDSIKGQSDDILIVDYSSDDNIEEIAKEYGFRFFRVDKVKGILYHDPKLYNKAIYEAKYNLLVLLSPDIIYVKGLTDFILEWSEKYDPEKYFLVTYLRMQTKDGKINGIDGYIAVYYRPFLLKIRGIDERTYIRGGYERGTHPYSIRVLVEIFNLKRFNVVIMNNIHRFHKSRHSSRWTPLFRILVNLELYVIEKFKMLKGKIDKSKKISRWVNRYKIYIMLQYGLKIIKIIFKKKIKKILGEFSATELINSIKENFNVGVKNVVNSYW